MSPQVADVGCVARLCSLFHQRYSEFTPLLKKLVEKLFENISCKDEEKVRYIPHISLLCGNDTKLNAFVSHYTAVL